MEDEIKNQFFYCYSKNLMYFLKSQDISYENDGFNLKSNSKFYKFKKSKSLDEAIKMWNVVKQLKQLN